MVDVWTRERTSEEENRQSSTPSMVRSSYGFTGLCAGAVGVDALWESEVDVYTLCVVDVLFVGVVFYLEL